MVYLNYLFFGGILKSNLKYLDLNKHGTIIQNDGINQTYIRNA